MSTPVIGATLSEAEFQRRYRSRAVPAVGAQLSDEEFEQNYAPKPLKTTPVRTVVSHAELERRETLVERPSDRPQYLTMPRETTIAPLPKPGLLQRAKEAIFGGVRTGETVLSDVLSRRGY